MPRVALPTLLLASTLGTLTGAARLEAADPPKPEFRGVWVATVANIDWPSKPGLPADEQKRELLAILDNCLDLNLNAVVFQVRPMCDALYESRLEPWSSFLTGEQGQHPGYDPLAFAVAQSHRRGMELHAWFNPYRAWSTTAKCEPAPNHLVKTRPDLAKKYGKHHWLNPTSKEVQAHSLAVMLDVVKRYDVDGIHMDDYFYPYPEKDADEKEIPFPDDDTWAAYRTAGGKLTRDDWRRDAVNSFVKRLYEETHRVKPWVKVGISPFGIWRPGSPMGIRGFDQYAKLYADAKLWLNEGWVDYWTPQLYWAIDKEEQSYPKLLDWWVKENTKGRHIWPGNGAYRHTPEEIAKQVELTRKARAGGNVFFSYKSLTGAKGDALRKLYPTQAPIPETPWLCPRPGEVRASIRESKMPRATKRDALRAESRSKLVHELFDGELFRKPRDPSRGPVVIELCWFFGQYLKTHDIGFMLGSEALLALRRGVVVSPDFSIIPWDRCPRGKVPLEPSPRLTPVLAVDISGTSSTPRRIACRHVEYFLAGVTLVWVIDPRTRAAAVFTVSDAQVAIPPTGTLVGGDVLPGFRLPLSKLFERLEKPAAKQTRRKK